MKIVTAALISTVALGSLPALGAEAIRIPEVPHIHGISFDPSQPGSFFLATHGGLFRAGADGMATQVSSDSNDYMGFTPKPGQPSTLLASGHPPTGGGLGVIASQDNGSTWRQIAEGVDGPVDFHAMTISVADPTTMYGLYGSIQVSRDSGETWAKAASSPDQVIDLAASANDPNWLYAGTMTGLMQSKDGLKSWEQLGPAKIPVTLVETTPDGTLYAFFVGTGLFKLSAGAWSIVSEKPGDAVFMHLAVDPADATHLLAVTQESAVLESRDGGATWTALSP